MKQKAFAVRYWIYTVFILFGWLILNNSGISAKETDPVISLNDRATVISDHEFYSGQQDIMLALRIHLKPGWHTYWKNPGEAGEAASITVQGQEDQKVKKADIEWPVPERLNENGLMSFIYKGDVVLPFRLPIVSNDHKQELHLHITARWLVCNDVCIPEEGQFTLVFSRGNTQLSPQAPLIQNALAQRPKQPKWKMHITSDGRLWINNEDIKSDQLMNAWFMPDANGVINLEKDQKFIRRPGFTELDLPILSQKIRPDAVTGILALQYKDHSIQYWSVSPEISALPMIKQGGILLLIGAAFLGGLLLNCMPCVFPVIAMKLLALSRMQCQAHLFRYKTGIAYGIGVLCCFLLIALATFIVRWAGHQIGWGFQFQSAIFLGVLCWVLFTIALNFLDLFSIQFSFTMGNNVSKSHYISDFMTGLLVVLIATPCTAPFMGIALTVALNSSLMESFILFGMMGVGLAFPYLILSFTPSLVRFLPKAGIWMEYFRQFLAFPMLLSCIWLLWVIDQYQNPLLLLLVLLGCFLIGVIVWLWNIHQKIQMMTAWHNAQRMVLGMMIAIFIMLAGIGACIQQVQDQSSLSHDYPGNGFSMARIEQLQKEHKPVLVNITASWCLTCLVNEKVALSSSRVQQAFLDNHITYIVGDWTHDNPEIDRFLKLYHREGVPLYVYYPSRGDPQILPQILTPALILNRLETKK